ncbi:bola domain-containing protein [Thamnocephalis sphaerospora]|uniref:Bola domain-containing protein n=1 Tax=Thamnocephalis sphaerospora TaxID=78915 RepID=A0A4P9XMK3_9FUNG|nr:bola domain-containing protein [Thamnocephalis sphaerospora]|eukprot:RKP07167.1 bola domain-containing protein [Thamnocephalis sphaerospora]
MLGQLRVAAHATRALYASTPAVLRPFAAAMSTNSATGPLQLRMEEKIRAALEPSELLVKNESHLHRHHAPMQGVTSTETHFRTNALAQSLMQRHRMIYKLLAEEMAAEGGVHALALNTKTPQEYTRV